MQASFKKRSPTVQANRGGSFSLISFLFCERKLHIGNDSNCVELLYKKIVLFFAQTLAVVLIVFVDSVAEYEVGKAITVEVFKEGDKVDVVGMTKGHGFSGVIKRWNQHRLKETHGVGPVHREVGSMGSISDPSRVFKNKHLPGHYGHEQVTIQNLEVVRVDAARGVLLIKGAIPGPKGGVVCISDSVKA